MMSMQLISFCAKNGIHVSAYSPLGSPDQFSAEGLNRKSSGAGPMSHPSTLRVAALMQKHPAQVLLRWGVQRGTSVLPKSVHESRLRENLEAVEWSLPIGMMELMSKFKEQYRLMPGAFHVGPKKVYDTLTDLWDEDVGWAVGRPFERPIGFRFGDGHD